MLFSNNIPICFLNCNRLKMSRFIDGHQIWASINYASERFSMLDGLCDVSKPFSVAPHKHKVGGKCTKRQRSLFCWGDQQLFNKLWQLNSCVFFKLFSQRTKKLLFSNLSEMLQSMRLWKPHNLKTSQFENVWKPHILKTYIQY